MKVFPDKKALLVPAKRLNDVGLKPNSFSRTALIRSTKEVVLPFDIPTIKILYRAGIDTAGPIKFEYAFKWHKEFPPFDHQKTTADFITKLDRGFIFNDIGTGKTLSALWALDYLIEHGFAHKVLIVTTVSTLWSVWADTIFKSFPRRSFEVLAGVKDRRLKLLDRSVDFYIVNHDGLKVLCDWESRDKKKYLISSVFDSRPDIDFVLVDECAIVRNAATGIYTALRHIAGPQTDRKLWMMSGDPMPNKPTDIWAQAQLIKRGLLSAHFVRFRNKVMRKISDYKWIAKNGWEQYIYSELKHYSVRFVRDECLDLPPRVYLPRQCQMSPEQQKAYLDMVNTCKAEIANQKITAVNEGVKITKLLQIAGGCIYDKDSFTHYLNTEAKYKLLLEAIEQSHHKLIVFAPFVHIVEMLKEKLDKKFKIGVVYGKVSKKKRNEIFHAFQHGDLQILLAQPKTMSHGLDLTSAHTICWWAPIDDYEIFNQANGRVTRPGQTSTQTIIELICSGIEKKIYKRLENKEKLQGLLMDLFSSKEN